MNNYLRKQACLIIKPRNRSHIATPCYSESVKANSCFASSTEGAGKGESYWEGLLGIAPGQPTKGIRDTSSETHDILRQVIMDVLNFT